MATAAQASLAFLVVPGRPPGTLFVTRAGARAGRHFQAPQRLAAALARLAARQSTRVRVRRRDGYRALGGGRWAALGARWSVVGGWSVHAWRRNAPFDALSTVCAGEPAALGKGRLVKVQTVPLEPAPVAVAVTVLGAPCTFVALVPPARLPRPVLALAPTLVLFVQVQLFVQLAKKKKKKPKIREKESVSTLQRRTAAATVNGTPSESR